MTHKRILLIDDEPDVLVYLSLALQDNGYEPIPADSAARGLEIMRARPPDLICLDILMPRQTGISLYNTIRHESGLRHVPIVIITGLSVTPDGEGGLIVEEKPDLTLASPDGVIEKPVNLTRFLEIVGDLTGSANGGDRAQR